MKVYDTISDFRDALASERAAGHGVGLILTMGCLHEGHVSLLERARNECETVAATIFVNPLQFGAGEDLAAYPRDIESDLKMAEHAGVDHLLAPSVEEMYPTPVTTAVRVDDLSASWEGASRPTHFSGVATVVAKLFNIAGPVRAYFGEKDFQQLAVIRRMVADLSLPVDVIGCSTIRESDGLALSSRNVYLEPGERRAAPILYRALTAARDLIETGETDPGPVVRLMTDLVGQEPAAELDYAAVVDASDLTIPTVLTGELRLLIAVRFGRARLIDNLGVTCTGA